MLNGLGNVMLLHCIGLVKTVTGGPEICKEGEILQQSDGEEVAEGDFYIKLKYFEFVSVTCGNWRRSIKSLAMGWLHNPVNDTWRQNSSE